MTKAKTEVAPVEIETNDDLAPAVAPSNEVATTSGAVLGEATGEVGSEDIKFPSLRIMQKMSENPDKLDDGTITLDNSLIVQDENGEVRMTVLSIHKYYKEVLDFGAGIPRSFDSRLEAEAEGFKVARCKADRDSGVPLVEDAARAIVAIEKPEGALDRSFPLEIDGVRMIPAIWWIQSSAYKSAAKTIFSKLSIDLRTTGLLPAVWKLGTNQINGARGVYYTPRVSLLNEERSPEFIQALRENIKI